MTLYEIDKEILSCIDPVSGEIINFDKLEKLNMERNLKTNQEGEQYR